MPKVSRIPLDRKIQYDLINEFWYALGKLNREKIELLLKEILSPTEVIMLAKRLEVIKQLKEKRQYSVIKESIRVTEPTIAKMSTIMQRANNKFTLLINDLIQDEEMRWKKYIDGRKPHWVRKKVYYTSK